MKFKRVSSGGETVIEAPGETGWTPLHRNDDRGHPDLVGTSHDHPPRGTAGHDGGALLPFQPLSYRDFMLYERHYIQAARGHLRRFRPSVARVTRGFEAVTGRVFPP